MPDHITDDKRRKIETALVASLLLIYRRQAALSLAQLGLPVDTGPSDPTVTQKIGTFAADRAQKIQDGINKRLAAAALAGAVRQAKQEIKDYNRDVLTPYMESWATHQAIVDVYASDPAPDGEGSMLDWVMWTWEQTTDFYDDCTQAEASSPASYDELIGITGSPPPVHPRCSCLLYPVTGSRKD